MNLPQMYLSHQMDFPTYLADPAPEPSLTSSLVKGLLSTAPRKIWQKTKRLNPSAPSNNKAVFDLGSAAHTLFTGEGEPIVWIDADSYRSKDAKDERDAAHKEGKTPILAKDKPLVEAMADAAKDQFADNPDIGPLLQSETLLRECSIFWKEAGCLHRCRPDFYDPETNTIIHYKTTGVSIAPSELSKYAANSGWYLIAAHYAAGIKAMTGRTPKQYFAVQETEAPHLCVVAELDATFMATAAMRRDRAMMIWARCLRDNNWPGYPRLTAKLECPEWLERNLTADKDAELEAINNGADLLELAKPWTPPEGLITAEELFGKEVIE